MKQSIIINPRIIAWILAFPLLTHTSTAQHQSLERFDHMTDGQWITNIQNGTTQYDTWNWSLEKHALIGYTRNSERNGESTSGIIRLIYHDPRDQQFKLLAIAGGGLVSRGSITFEGNDALFDLNLYYSEETQRAYQVDAVRHLQYGWFFDDDDTHHARWYEDRLGKRVFETAWLYTRHDRDIEAHIEPESDLEHFSPVETLIGKHELPNNEAITIEQIPHTPALRLRRNTSETILYFHEGTDRLQYLTITRTGQVHEGAVTIETNRIILVDRESTSWITLNDDNLLIWTKSDQAP